MATPSRCSRAAVDCCRFYTGKHNPPPPRTTCSVRGRVTRFTCSTTLYS
jgi:hypothetical protein